MWIGIDDAEILIEDLLFEEERVDLRVSFLGEGATARAKDKVWDDAIISVFFLNIYIYVCVCVCCDIYTCVKWRFFSPSKKKGRLNAKHNTCHTFSQIFHLNLSLFVCSKKREKKNRESKKRWIFSRILHLFVSHYVIIYYVELFSLCAYTIKRGLGKREKTSAYKSNNTNKRERERKKEQFW